MQINDFGHKQSRKEALYVQEVRENGRARTLIDATFYSSAWTWTHYDVEAKEKERERERERE